jgi:hypothetical protein
MIATHYGRMTSRRGYRLAAVTIGALVIGGVGGGASEAAQRSGNQCKKKQVGVTAQGLTCQKVGAKYVWTVATAQVAATPSAPACHPSYEPCVPVASDVDCAGGSGNGPAYVRGPVRVLGSDPYGLDRDGDGIGCEKN